MLVAPDARSAAPSLSETITAGMSSSKPSVLPSAVGSPATLLTMITPTAPAALALATFTLKVQPPRSISTILPAAPAGTEVQPSDAASNRPNVPPGSGSKSPVAARAVPEPSGPRYATGWPTKWSLVEAPTVMTLRARPGEPT